MVSFPRGFEQVRGATPEPIGIVLAAFAAMVPRDQAIVELGVFCGRTALQMAWGAKHGRDAHVWGIDAWDLPGNLYAPPFTDPETRELAFRNVEAQGFADRVTLIHAFSHDIAATWDGPKVGLLFVDGDHSAEGARRDITLWAPHLAPGAVIAIDDYGHPDWPGVAEAVGGLAAPGFLGAPGFLNPIEVFHDRLAITSLTAGQG